MGTLRGFIVEMGLDPTKFDKGIEKETKKVLSTKQKFAKFGAGFSAAFTGPALVAGAALLHLGDQHDDLTDKLRINTGKTGDALKDLDNRALEVFGNIPTTMSAVGDAFSLLSQKTNDTGADLQNVAQSELELARITGTDLAGNIDATTKLFNNWNVAGKDQTATLDKLFRASQATGVGVAQLSSDVASAGPILREMGFDLDSSVALFAQLEKAGIDTSTAVTGLRTAFKKFGDEGLTDTNAALADVFAKIQNAPDDLAAGQVAIDTFGSRAGPALAESIRSGKLSYQDLLKTIRTGTDTIVGVAAGTNDWKENLQILRNRISVLVLPAADKLFAAINKGIPYLETLVDRFQSFTDWLGKLSPRAKLFGEIFLGVLIGIGPALLGIAAAMQVVEFAGAGLGVILSPITLTVIALAAVGFLLYKAWKGNWFGIRDITKSAVKAIVSFLSPLIKTVEQVGRYFYDVATNRVQPFGKEMKSLPGWIRPVAFVLARIIKSVRVFFVTWRNKGFVAALMTIRYQIRAFGRAFAAFLGGLLKSKAVARDVRAMFYSLADLFANVVKLVGDVIHGRWGRVWDDLKAIAKNAIRLVILQYRLIGDELIAVFNLIPWGELGHALWSGLKSAATFMKDKGVPFLSTKAAELFGAFYDAAGEVWKNDIKPFAESLPGRIADVIGAHWREVYDVGRTVLGWVWTGIASLIDWLGVQAHGIPNAVYNGVQAVMGWLYNAGRDIVSAVWTGISSLGGWLYQQVWDFVSNHIVDPFAKRIGWHSPPTLFIEAGEDISTATALGIGNKAHVARRAAAAMLGDASGGRVTIGANGNARATVGDAGATARAGAGGNRSMLFGPGSIVVQAGKLSRAEANRLARYILEEADRLEAAGAT